MNEENKNSEVVLDPTQVGEMELPKFDPTPYIGNQSKIAQVRTMKGVYGHYLKVESEPVTTFGENEIIASKILNLVEIDGKIGWGSETKTAKFLKSMGVAHYTELVGKDVVLVTTEPNKDGLKFLTF